VVLLLLLDIDWPLIVGGLHSERRLKSDESDWGRPSEQCSVSVD